MERPPREPWGLHLVHDGPTDDPSHRLAVDIIAVHGLGAHPDHAWVRHKVPKDGKEVDVRWLTDLLPETLQDYTPSIRARIFCFNYQSAWLGSKLTKNRLENIAVRLLDDIHHIRIKDLHVSDRPLIFVGHSFGGLVIEQAVVNANSSGSQYEYLINLIAGVILLGTPHQGSKTQKWGSILAHTASLIEYGETILMDDVDEKSMKVFDLVYEFMQIMIKTDLAKTNAIICFCENSPTDYLKRKVYLGRWIHEQISSVVVEETSAVLPGVRYIVLDSDHLKLNKFVSAQEGNYLSVSSNLARIAAQAPKLMTDRRKLTSRLHTYFHVSRKRVKDFAGREDQLFQILSYFSVSESTQPRVLILHALGGQGKSQVALEYCQRSRETYRGIFWVNASSKAAATQSFESIAAELNRAASTSLENAEAKIRFVVNVLEHWDERWMLVFDNYDNPHGFSDVEQFIPSNGCGDILVTSRNKGLDRLGTIIEIPPMSTEEGVSLLLRGYEGVNKDDHMLEGSKIVARLGGLALAIDQAAAYINYKRLPVERLPYFLTVYEAERKKILKYTPDNFWEYGTMQLYGQADQNRAISAFTTWEMSFQQLESDDEQRKKNIAHFLTLSAFFDPTNIGESLFRFHWKMSNTRLEWMQIFVPVEEVESGDETSSEEEQTRSRWDAERFWDVLHRGYDLSLLQSISNGSGNEGASFSLHPLIRDWLQLRETSKQRRLYTKEGIDFVVSSIQEYETLTTTPQQRRLLMAHMDACLSNDEQFSGYKRSLGYEIGTCDVASRFADFYSYQGRNKMSEKLLHLIVETRNEQLGLEHPDTQTSMASLTLIYQNQGRWKEAETLGVQVTEVMKRVLGEKHPGTLRSMATLAVTYQNQGRWKSAETLEVQIASTMESVLGKEHPTTLNSMGNLASTYRNRGLWEEAETLELQVIEIMKRVLGEEHPDTLISMANLALTYKDQGRWKEAETLEVHVTKIMRSVLGEEHPRRLMGMAILASIYLRQERWKEAETLGVQVTEIMKRVMGEEHPDTLTSMGDLALAYQNLERWEEAETLGIQVMKISMKVLGEEHSHTLTSMGNLASIYRDQRRWKEAEELEVQVMETRKRVLGLEHPDTLTSMDNVASAFGSQGRWKEAEKLEVQVMETRKRVLGLEHPDTLTSMDNVASAFGGQGWWKEAEKLDVQVMVCAGCGSDKAKGGSGPLKKCGRCKKARYCSAECQKADWKQHKVICRK